MKRFKREDDFSDIEDMLKGMTPIAPSEQFFASVEAALSEESDNTVAFPPMPRRKEVSFLSFRRASASVALLLGAVGLGIWGFSTSPETSNGNIASDSTIHAAAGSVLSTIATGVQNTAATASRKRRTPGNFCLVNVERRMNSAKPMDVVVAKDGSISRRMHYSYMEEYRWEDEDAGAAFVELRPHEEIVCMEMPVY